MYFASAKRTKAQPQPTNGDSGAHEIGQRNLPMAKAEEITMGIGKPLH